MSGNLAEWIERESDGEPIEAVVIGKMDGYRTESVPGQKINTQLTWAEARPMLDYEFDDGFGSAGCNPVYVWTRNWLILIREYDGATCAGRVPRNPIDIKPRFA